MRPTMSQYANKRDYDRAMAQRDLSHLLCEET
jgi:hypothetical protein